MEEQWKAWLREHAPELYAEMQNSLRHDFEWRDKLIAEQKAKLETLSKAPNDAELLDANQSVMEDNKALREKLRRSEQFNLRDKDGNLVSQGAFNALASSYYAMLEKQPKLKELEAEVERVKNIGIKFAHEVEQTLAQAIGGFAWYKDDQKNFPGSTEADGMCVGELVAGDLLDHAAKLIREHNASIRPIENAVEALKQIAIYDQDTRPLPNGTGSFAWDAPFDWRRRSMKQEDLARAAWKAFHEAGVLPTKPATDDELMRLSIFMPVRLHAATKDLVVRFASALADKLHAAEKKYGYSDNWRDSGWMDECREHLLTHLEKGDPRDVANFCMFLWHHGEKTSLLGRDWYDAVLKFHEKFGQLIALFPQIPSDKVRTLRCNLISEEAKELDLALLSNNMPEIADACADLIYVIVGTAISYGIDLRPVFNEVQRTNMAKENGGTRGDGKVMKPAGWTPPDIEGVLVKQGWVKPPDLE